MTPTQKPAVVPLDAARITVIDDTQEVVDVIREVLTEAGYAVTSLTKRTSANAIAATRPDLVILDLVLRHHGRTTGWDYLKMIRSHPDLRDVPVLLCSADIRGLRERQNEVEADPHVAAMTKPFSVDQLEAAVSALVALTAAPRWDDDVDVVLVADADAQLQDASHAALELLGLSLPELRRRRVADIVANDPEWSESEWKRYRRVRQWEGPVALRRPDGTTMSAIATAEILGTEPHELHISTLRLLEPSASTR